MDKNTGICLSCGDVLPTDDLHTGPNGEPECDDCRRERQEQEDYRG